jgi:hypothetical protein
MPPPPYRHDALLNAAWLPFGDTLSHRVGESLTAYVQRLRAAVNPRDPDVPEVVKEATAAIIRLSGAIAMSHATNIESLRLAGLPERN